MTLRLIQGNLLIVDGDLANDADCCCPPPLPFCCDSRSVNYWQITDPQLAGGCCTELAGTYFPDALLGGDCLYRRVVDFAAPDPCTGCRSNTVLESGGGFPFGLVSATYYWSLKKIDLKTEIDDGTGYLGTDGGLTIQARTVLLVEFYRFRQVDYTCTDITGGFATEVTHTVTQCPFSMSTFFTPAATPSTSPCDPFRRMRLETFFNF
jgi:hypothetical protein